MSTFGFLLQVTCLSLRRRLRSEASVGEVCFDVVLASCCKGKRIPEIKKVHRALFHVPDTIVRYRNSMVRQKIDFSGLVGSFLEYWCTLTLKPGEAFGFFFSKS